MRKTLLILLCILIFSFSGCNSKPISEGWQPYYTGEDREWDYERPWDWDQSPDAKREFNQDQALEAYQNLGVCSEADYAGAYTNDSGTLTVMITNPTAERAKYYGELCKVGVWVVEAEYTANELNLALLETPEIIEQWLADNPGVSLRLDGWGISSYQNRAVFHLSGNDGEIMKSQLELPGCVALEFYETADSSDASEIPWEPVYQWNSGAISVYLDRAEFPVGVKNINITLENRSDGNLSYGHSFSMEKYVDGDWINASGNMSFTLEGYALEEYDKETFYINTESFPEPLGVGLYRITGSSMRYAEYGADTAGGQDYEELGSYVLEFAVTEDAEPEPEPVDTIYNPIAEKEDWQWFGIRDLVEEQVGVPASDIKLKGPYFAHIVGNGNNMDGTTTTEFTIDLYDRSTGNRLTDESLVFSGDFQKNIICDRFGNLYIRAADTDYMIWYKNSVNIISDVGFTDEDIPYPPESSDTALDGGLTIEMEQQYYTANDDSIVVLLTNNTEKEMVIEYKRSDYGNRM